MARKKKTKKKVAVENYKHESAKRKNIPTAKMAAEGKIPSVKKAKYSYSPHLDPELRFDSSGRCDRIGEIVEKAAAGTKLSGEESEILRGFAANASQPWLEWTGKKEEHDRGVLEVEPVALHIHERVSANAIIRAAKREDIQADLFADPMQEYKDAIQFYQHDVDWANRLILGDSLEVMSSLARREDLAGKVQMIYIDPPYGIKFRSNFQPELASRNVGEKDHDLTREPEMVRAFRDTWHLGLHSYLTYMRDRLIVAKDLLADQGSIFVQIGDENLHHIKSLLDDVMGAENFVSLIAFTKGGGGLETKNRIAARLDYILWYSRSRDNLRFNQIYMDRNDPVDAGYNWIEFPSGMCRRLTSEEKKDRSRIPDDVRFVADESLTKPGPGARYGVSFQGREFDSGRRWWGMPKHAMDRSLRTERIMVVGNTIRRKKYFDESAPKPFNNLWDGLGGQSNPQYVVQTNLEVIRRCMLMTTDPGDLVLDPTCGSGSTAVVAEELGRRWITCDTSRVAVSIARQRIITSSFPFYKLTDDSVGVSAGMECRSVANVTVSKFSQLDSLDPLLDNYDNQLDKLLVQCNKVRAALHKETGVAESSAFSEWQHWQVPYDICNDWPKKLRLAVEKYREVFAEKKVEVDKAIQQNVSQEFLLDKPIIEKNILRVSGPYTVEGVRPEELSLDEDGAPFDPTLNAWEIGDGNEVYSQNASAYLDRMLKLISQDGMTFPDNVHRNFSRIDRLEQTDSALHAEASWDGHDEDSPCNVGVAFGPQVGPVTAEQVEDLVRAARRYDELVIAGFSFDAAAQAVIQESENPRLKIHMTHVRPDISPGMDGLLKDSPKSQLFTVFGQPEIEVRRVEGTESSEVEVILQGVDIYSPLSGEIVSTGGDKVSAWFLDSDYDGRCFCVTQAYFPNQNAWGKIVKALGSAADEEAFAAYDGTVSLPFEVGKHKRIAVKVIDPRGNEVMAIRSLEGLN